MKQGRVRTKRKEVGSDEFYVGAEGRELIVRVLGSVMRNDNDDEEDGVLVLSSDWKEIPWRGTKSLHLGCPEISADLSMALRSSGPYRMVVGLPLDSAHITLGNPAFSSTAVIGTSDTDGLARGSVAVAHGVQQEIRMSKLEAPGLAAAP